ncbi:MAG: ribonuclease P protein component [Myxococcales bacterium]|nr:ribonuclease P protein component [Myxococcales bacterium]|tara:strand:- start:12632 stop:12982 length:351 start_codon:yes stop_codon:yes gene_type:complete
MSAAVETLKRRHDFLRVAAAKNSRALRGLVLQASPNNNSEDIRVGYTASRRVGNAVTRNRARRRLRAAVGEVMPLHAARGFDYVVIARVATVARPFVALRGDLESALKHLKVWRDE